MAQPFVRVVPAKTTRVNSATATNFLQVKTSAGNLVGLLATNLSGSDLFLQLHDATSHPDTGDVPVFVVRLEANTSIGIDTPINCASGIWVGFSSTAPTFTSAGSTGWFCAQIY